MRSTAAACRISSCTVLAGLYALLSAHGCGGRADVTGGGDAGAPRVCVVPARIDIGIECASFETIARPPCFGAGLCGNGYVDNCQSLKDYEDCDGSAFLDVATSCAQLGYTGGRLACYANCRADMRQCDACLPDHVAACVSVVFDTPNGFGGTLASDGDNIAVAFDAPGGVRFGLLTSKLQPIGASGCFGTEGSFGAVAPTSLGWLFGVQLSDHADLYGLDPCGALIGGPKRLDGEISVLSPRVMNGKANAGPLLAWYPPAMPLSVVLLDDAGNFQTTPATVDPAAQYARRGPVRVVSVENGFLIAASYSTSSSEDVTTVTARIGAVSGMIEASQRPIAGDVRDVSLAKLGEEIYFAYTNSSITGGASGRYWLRLDANGAAISPSTPIARHFSSELVAFGSWMGVANDGTIGGLVIAPIFGSEAPPFLVARAGSNSGYWDVLNDPAGPIVAWMHPGFGMARVQP